MQAAVMTRSSPSNTVAEVHTYFDCGPNSFVIDIVDRSNAPAIEVGDAVAIDPDVAPRPGDMVLALIKPAEVAVFRRYNLRTGPDGAKYVELQPLNETWDTDLIRGPEDGAVVGVMTEHVTPRR